MNQTKSDNATLSLIAAPEGHLDVVGSLFGESWRLQR